MKRSLQLGVIFILITAWFPGLSVSRTEAADYLGQFCWFVETGTDSGIIKFGITHMGDGHYLVNGKFGPTESLHGNAEIEGGKIYLTTNSSGSDDQNTWTYTGRGVLDAKTLNGTLEIMGVSHSKTSPDPKEAHMDYEGPFTLTFMQCPQ